MTSVSDLTDTLGLPENFKLKTGTNGHSRRLKFLVTGGCGYFGYKLGKVLHTLGADVTLLDIQLPLKIQESLDDHLKFIRGDIRDYDSVLKSSAGMDCVYHVASFGMSGKDQLYKDLTEAINVDGTRNVIKACQMNNVQRLIYTSSYNVVLEGNPIIGGDESLPYADPNKIVDYYSKSKLKADKLILEANNTELNDGRQLKTCCLRPAGIYGPGERRHIQRIAKFIDWGIIIVRIGDAVVDWTHVNNLIQAHLLAIPGLSKTSDYVAAGKAYFISDNRPLRVFDFLRPLFNGLGQEVPRYKCPYTIVYILAILMEMLHYILKPVIVIEPLLTRNEIMKMGIDHHHKMDQAINDLGYKPMFYDFADTVALYLKERGSVSEKSKITFHPLWTSVLFTIVTVIITISLCL
ncbi:short-chain dehydrogenase/reductase family 42E member 1 [Ciona intestinalis]